MTLTTRNRRSGTPARPVCLVLAIDPMLYQVRPLPCDPLIAHRAFRLRKPDGTIYDVVETAHGPECDCPDFIFRRDGIDPAGCKHIQALIASGMIDRPAQLVDPSEGAA